MRPRRWLPCVIVVLASCLGACAKPPTRGPADHGTSCAGVGMSTLPGACIRFLDPAPTFSLAKAAAGVEIAYEVIVEADISGVVPRAQDAGDCDIPGASGLTVFERLEGGDLHYCACDSGLCAPFEDDSPRTIPAGRSTQRFTWNGTSWDGASDTDNPYGPPMPPGTYVLEVSAVGSVDGALFEIRNSIEVTLTP